MIIRVITPSGSIIHHPNMQGAAEAENGDLILLHKDGTERLYIRADWTRFHAERTITAAAAKST